MILPLELSAKGPEATILPAALNARPSDPLEYISASRLKSFLTCRLKFYFEKVLGIQKPVSVKLHLGRSVHESLKAYHRSQWLGQPITTAELHHHFNESFIAGKQAGEIEATDENEWESQKAIGERILEAYQLSGYYPLNEKPVGVEVELREEIPAVPLPLLGVVDLIRSGNHIVDFKTTATSPNEVQEKWLHELQLVAYALMVESAIGEPIRSMDLVFLVKTKQPKVIVVNVPAPDETQKQRFRELVNVYYRGVRLENYYPSPGQHCAWCPYRQECQEWSGLS